MTRFRFGINLVTSFTSVTFFLLFAQNCAAGGSDCTQGASVKVCVEWSQGPNPEHLVDYSVTFSDALNPDIELAEGDPTWTVWSELLSNGDPANIGSLTTTDSENYGVKIAKGSGPGAANLATANLTPAGGHHSSLASGSRISGDLTGSLTVVRDSGGSGGAANLAVDGNVSGNLTIPVLNGLSVGGDLSGDVAVTHLLDGPLSVTGEVTAASDITVADGDGNVTFDGAFAGTITLNGGGK
jgi:hypothetical protein